MKNIISKHRKHVRTIINPKQNKQVCNLSFQMGAEQHIGFENITNELTYRLI